MSDLDSIRKYLGDLHLRDTASGAAPLAPTHLFELFVLMKSGLGDLAQSESVNYDAHGLNAQIRFADRKRYSIHIKEIV